MPAKKKKIRTQWKRLRAAINAIIKNGENRWDQAEWHSPCGTAHCFAGWGDVLSGEPIQLAPKSPNVRHAADKKQWADYYKKVDAYQEWNEATEDRARTYFGLTTAQTEWLFAGDRDFHELYFWVASRGKAFGDPLEPCENNLDTRRVPKLD